MQKLPTVVICGRPNVGKSSLFNLLAHRRISIVDPAEGVTRDRVATVVRIGETRCELVDTGGIGLEDESQLGEQITHHSRQAIEGADLVLFLVDIQNGVTPLDCEVAALLKRHYGDKTVWLIANKTDSPKLLMEKEHFRKLGFGEPMGISAAHQQGTGELKERLVEYLEALTCESPLQPQEMPLKIAVVGKTNAGKSTFINSLAGEERMIVSEMPGTTRDSVDVHFEKDGKTIVAIDTAGLKRSKSFRDNVDFYSQTRAQKAIRRCDVVIFMFDASTKISNVDKQLANYIRGECKPVVIAINKWDLALGKALPEDYEKYLAKNLPELAYAPMVFLTAQTGKNVWPAIDLARNIHKQSLQRVSTGELNRALKQKIVVRKSPPLINGKQGKIFYATQIDVAPPMFVLFVNSAQLFPEKYRRYLFNQFQREFSFPEVAVKFQFRERTGEEEEEAETERQ